MQIQEHAEELKTVGDITAFTAAIATFFDYLPDATALLAFIWLLIRVWESNTVQKFVGRWKK